VTSFIDGPLGKTVAIFLLALQIDFIPYKVVFINAPALAYGHKHETHSPLSIKHVYFYPTAATEIKAVIGPKVICPSPETDYPFLDNLPKKCNILLKPSKVASTPTESKFQTAFQKFLNGNFLSQNKCCFQTSKIT
jgi:hypothetical protein